MPRIPEELLERVKTEVPLISIIERHGVVLKGTAGRDRLFQPLSAGYKSVSLGLGHELTGRVLA